MPSETQIVLFGSLQGEGENIDTHLTGCTLQGPIPLHELLKRLHLQPDRVQMAMVNHQAVPPDHVVHPGDRVALFPKEFPIYPDWKDFRR